MKLACAVLSLLIATTSVRAAAPNLVNGIAVIVGDAVITYKDIQMAIEEDLDFLESRFRSQPRVLAEKAAELEKARLQEMVDNQLILQEFKRAGYIEPESHIEGQIEKDIARYGDRLNLIRTLQARGLTFETYKNRIREREILRLMWHHKVPNDPLISPAKIENYYVQNRDKFKMEDQIKLKMIVLTNAPNNASYSPKKLAQEISAKLKENVPFEDLARVYSQGSQSAEGGDWGWVEKSVLREDLASVAFGLESGQVSPPVETPVGVYIMLVEDKKVSYIKTLSEVRDEIEATLKAEENQRLKQVWIDQLKAKSFVRYF